jgi:hypothetical protein
MPIIPGTVGLVGRRSEERGGFGIAEARARALKDRGLVAAKGADDAHSDGSIESLASHPEPAERHYRRAAHLAQRSRPDGWSRAGLRFAVYMRELGFAG